MSTGGDDGLASGAGETIEINWESPEDVEGGVEIDWGGVDEGIGNVDFEVVEDSNVVTSEGEVVAVGKEALTLLGWCLLMPLRLGGL